MRRLPLLFLMTLIALPAGAQWPGELEMFAQGWPRAFYFRASEGQARTGRYSYEQWAELFLPMGGIMGKSLNEEIPDRALNLEFFTRYKSENPAKVVLLHYNGNSRDPRDAGPGYFAGHWVYLVGCGLKQDLPAEGGEMVAHVADASRFRTQMGRFNDRNEDIGICALGPNGKPDWSRAEQVELVSKDQAAGTITIRRGAFGTQPLQWQAGQTYLAAHATDGPFGRRSNLLWCYNYSTTCPRDAQGRSCSDVLMAELAKWFGPGGVLERFDGLEFDVSNFSPAARGYDCDADGVADDGWIDGVSVYGLGVYRFHEALRAALGEQRFIMADGGTPRCQRSFGSLSGIESEGWPGLGDWEIADWSGGLNRHLYWRDHARQPALNYINHKFTDPGGDLHQVPMNISRLVMAAALFTDAALTWSLMPPMPQGTKVDVYDELWAGAEHRPHWLGQPLGPPVRIGLQTPDLLGGQAAPMRLTGADGAADIEATFGPIEVPAGDLLVSCTIQAEPRACYPEAVPRLVWLGCEGAGQFISPRMPDTGVVLADGAEQSIQTDTTGALLRYFESRAIAGESHEAYFVHPPYRDGNLGVTFWEREVHITKGQAKLSFYTGLAPTRGASDGLGYRVIVMDGDAREQVFEVWHKQFAWVAHEVDLSRWAGRTVTLRFESDAGPEHNPTADHGYWGDARVGAKPFVRPEHTPARIMTFAGAEPFASSFYFRDIGPETVNLTLQVEGPEPVTISGLTLHNAPDAIARAYEGGVVLANPSLDEVSFDLAALFPGRTLKRLTGTAAQDPATNNGQPVGATVTLPGRDALFLMEE